MSEEEVLEEPTLQTVSQHLSSQIPITSPETLVQEIREALAGRRFETSAAVAVCDGGLLRGLIRTEDLLAAQGVTRASEIMDDSPPVVAPGTDQEPAAWESGSAWRGDPRRGG